MEIIDNINSEVKKEKEETEKREEKNEVESRGMMPTYGKQNQIYSSIEGCLKLGDMAPLFEAETTLGPCKLSDFRGKWVCLFAHPASFTPVCSSEIIAFSKMESEFKKRNCCLIGLSSDSLSSHLAWINSLTKMTGSPINFPIIADPTLKIAKMYGMIAPNISETQTARDVFIICPEGTIKAKFCYPATNGRNISEILRLLDSLQFTETEKLYTPANWCPGMPALMPSPACYQEVVERMQNPGDMNCYDFYFCYKQGKMQNTQGIPNPNMQICPMPQQPPIPQVKCQSFCPNQMNNCGYSC